MTGTRAVIAAAGVALVLGVAACSGSDPEPRVAPPSSSAPSSPSTSPASAASGPTLPAAAAELSRDGAENFVDYWFAALSYGMTSGDTDAVASVSAADCNSCQALIRQIEKLYAKGGSVKTDGWAVEAKALNGGFDVNAPSFLLRIHEASRVLFDGAHVVDRTPMSKVPMHIRLSSGSGSWQVSDLEIIE